MNTYVLKPYSSKFPTVTNASAVLSQNDVKPYLKALSYALLWGQNDISVLNFDIDSVNYSALGITTSLDFSLSNVTLDPTYIQQVIYDTAFQGVREYLDKPYPIQGYMAIVIDTASDGTVYDPTSDLDNYVKFPIVFRNTVGSSLYQANVYVGVCNSSKTDYYTPFERNTYVILMDAKQAIQKTATIAAQRAVATASELPMRAFANLSGPKIKAKV